MITNDNQWYLTELVGEISLCVYLLVSFIVMEVTEKSVA